jgi:hypothetical protein
MVLKRIYFEWYHSLSSRQIRVVLSWGESPDDLDLHCTSSKGHHVYYNRRSDGPLFLDSDVRNGHGPETITVSIEPGVDYCFYVNHYGDDLDTLEVSSARLRIYGIPELTELSISRLGCFYKVNHGYWLGFKIFGSGKPPIILNQIIESSKSQEEAIFF